MTTDTVKKVICPYCVKEIVNPEEQYYIARLGQFCKQCWIDIQIDALRLIGLPNFIKGEKEKVKQTTNVE